MRKNKLTLAVLAILTVTNQVTANIINIDHIKELEK